ncbi:MAG: metal-sensing transcriptional repressor [Clostridia bacterium]|nr:metal-sensing transcriptional repressor [Clostridia bacterium]
MEENKMHKHSPEHTKAVLNRMSRAIGHLSSVKKMIEDERDCSEVLIQLSAVRAQITNLSKLILKEHLDHCIIDAVKVNDEESIAKLKEAIERLL